MATLSTQQSTPMGTTVTMAAASVGGDKVAPNDRGGLLLVSANASPLSALIAVPGNTRYGIANPDITVTIPANGRVLVAPLPQDLADPIDGLVAVTYPGGVTSLTVAAVSI